MEGLFDIVRDGPEGETVVIRTVDSGAISGRCPPSTAIARSAAVRASTQCRVLRVPGDDFRALIRSRPDLLEELFWQQVSWVRSLTEEVARTHRPAHPRPADRSTPSAYFRERLRVELERARETGDLLSVVLAEADDFDSIGRRRAPAPRTRPIAKLAQILHAAGRKGDAHRPHGRRALRRPPLRRHRGRRGAPRRARRASAPRPRRSRAPPSSRAAASPSAWARPPARWTGRAWTR
jgi:CRP-like cAMP-binding protein